jgi:hypothetical protein
MDEKSYRSNKTAKIFLISKYDALLCRLSLKFCLTELREFITVSFTFYQLFSHQ